MENITTKKKWLRQPGVLASLTAALLFVAWTPFAKILPNAVNPFLLVDFLSIYRDFIKVEK